jgi:type IV secretory pathway VirJ component
MYKALLAIALFLSFLPAAQATEGGRYGDVEVMAPSTPPIGLVILFSGAGGFKAPDRARLAEIADAGAIAVGVDTDAYLRNLAKEAEPGCLYLFRDAEGLSRELQREHPTTQYRVPIVAGEGRGGALASRIVAQAPLQTVGGAVAVDPDLTLPLARDICPRPLEADDREGPGTIDAPVLKNPWTVALTPAASATRAHFLELASKTKLMTVRDLPAAAHDAAFVNLIRPLLAFEDATSVANLPLVELPAAPRTRRMAVFISGDGGWRDVDKRVSERLQQLGVSVVGWDSLRYFWRRKTPDETAADLASVLNAYEQKWNCDEVALIGFSFGADVMPFLYNRLDADLKQRVALIALLSPARAADWEIQVAGWFGAGPSDAATPLAPEVPSIPGNRVLCFYGVSDPDAACSLFAPGGADIVEKQGDHHMNGHYDLIGRQIFDTLLQKAPA